MVVDFDNDGIPDILLNGKGALYLLRGLGEGRFVYANDQWGLPSAISPAVDEGACFGDIDNDGKLDIITCGRGPQGKERGVTVYHNDLPTQHWLNVQVAGVKAKGQVLDADAFRSIPVIADHLARVAWIGAFSQEPHHVAAGEGRDGSPDKGRIDLGQSTFRCERQIRGPFGLVARPIVRHVQAAKHRAVGGIQPLGHAIQCLRPPDRLHPIHQLLGLGKVIDPGEAVVVALVIHAGFVQAAASHSRPFMQTWMEKGNQVWIRADMNPNCGSIQ